jgi:hypothetical protein
MALIKSIAKLQRSLDASIAGGNLDSALRLIQRVVDQIYCEPINTARIFGSRFLDDYCQKIGAVNWQRISGDLPPRFTGGERHQNTVVFVASRLYATGGHTAVLADIIRLGPVARSIVLITGTVGKTDLAAVQRRFADMPQVSLICAPRGTSLEKLDWLQRQFLELMPKTVWLFNHEQDSVAIAAVQPGADYQLCYYHHGDHHLCLGVFLTYADHIDPHPMGFHNCRENLGIQDNRYLPLVIKDQGKLTIEKTSSLGTGLITCTATNPNKVEAPYFIRYADVVPKLLHTTQGKHVHIGPLSPLTRLRIRHGMHDLGTPMDRFIYVPYVPSVWRALHEYQVDLYVASFPIGGARTLIEAMGAGIAVALHLHTHSRLLSTFDMAFEGVYLWREPEQLYKILREANAETLKPIGENARRKYEEFYREEVLALALNDWEQPLPPPMLLEGYTSDKFQQALDISGQYSLVGLMNRISCRILRRWKSSRA